jgi:hypoxia up-regulated 1
MSFLCNRHRQVTHPSVKQFQQRFPFYDIVPDETRGTVTFKVNDDIFTVEELVGLVLKHAAENAAHFAGD